MTPHLLHIQKLKDCSSKFDMNTKKVRGNLPAMKRGGFNAHSDLCSLVFHKSRAY